VADSPYLRIHTIHIYVRDQDRSLRFYIDQLGFSLAFDVRLSSGGRWVGVSPPDGSTVLTLVAPVPESKEYQFIGRSTQVVLVTENVIAKYHEWRQRGVRFQNVPRLRRVKYELSTAGSEAPPNEMPVWGGIFTRFKDVDGNSFVLVGFDELNREIEAQRRAAREREEAERRAAYEIEIARQVQSRLFPQTLPRLNTLEYAGVCLQARQVGGDYYDYLDLGEQRLGLVIGDIAGKGMAAALLMANLQANLRSQCAHAAQPRRLLESVNRLFYDNTADSAYATLFFGVYDDRTGRLRYANCGHLAPLLLRRSGKLQRLDSTCTVMGLFKNWDCAIRECRLQAGDILALYTDGITESHNHSEEEFGLERLAAALETHRQLPAENLLAAVLHDVRRFSPGEQHDDITLVVARCKDA